MPPTTPYTEVSIADVMNTQIVPVETQGRFIDEIKAATYFFFGRGKGTFGEYYPGRTNFPIKGFVLAGPPGSGKTEAVRIAFRDLWQQQENQGEGGFTLRLFHVNPADINRAGVGDIEQNIRKVFTEAKKEPTSGTDSLRTIILFDDIETLLVNRTDSNAREWTRAANGVFFHELDRLPTNKVIVMATTNEPQLVDPAIHSRLSLRHVPEPTMEEMMKVAKDALPQQNVSDLPAPETLLELIQERIVADMTRDEDPEPPSFRLARKAANEIVIAEVVGWR